MKVVIDTNVVLSGIFFCGYPNKALLTVFDKQCKLILSEEIILEYKEILLRFANKKKMPIDEPMEILEILISDATIIAPQGIITPPCDDQDDIMFLEAAIASQAKYIISGDKHLLDVSCYPGGIVLNARDYVNKILQYEELH